jgi:opacity protein-like surface antigen
VTLDSFSSGGLGIDDTANLAFAWQFKAGVTYQLSPTWAANVGYRLYGTDNTSFTTSAGTSAKSDGALTQSAEIGFRFHF